MKIRLQIFSLLVLCVLFSFNLSAQTYPQTIFEDDFNDPDFYELAVGDWNTTEQAGKGIEGSVGVSLDTPVPGCGMWVTGTHGNWIPGHTYKATIWVKSMGNPGDIVAPVVFTFNDIVNQPNMPCAGPDWKQSTHQEATVLDITTEWQKQEVYVKAEKDGAINVTVWSFNGWNHWGGCVPWGKGEVDALVIVDNFKLEDMGPNYITTFPATIFEDDFEDPDFYELAVGDWSTTVQAGKGIEGSVGVSLDTPVPGCGMWVTGTHGNWTPGHTYKASIWVKSMGKEGDIVAPVVFTFDNIVNQPNKPCAGPSWKQNTHQEATVLDITTEWQKQEVYVKAEKDGAIKVTVWSFNGWNHWGGCMPWGKAEVDALVIVDNFKLEDMGPDYKTSVSTTIAKKPDVYISSDELVNVNGLVRVYDITGRVMIAKDAYNGKLNVSSLKTGIYIVHSENTATKVFKK